MPTWKSVMTIMVPRILILKHHIYLAAGSLVMPGLPRFLVIESARQSMLT
jgi:hypothetical protein